MRSITVFTPAYNRAHLLPRLYRSLCAQSSKDFTWLIVDDGSIDGTADLVRGWMDEGRIDVRYAFKANGGMHTAHNLAYDLIDTELNVCIDSDDAMPQMAVADIVARWKKVGSDRSIAGLLGLDADLDGKLIGSKFPTEGMRSTLPEIYQVHGVRGDKKVVLRSDLTRSYPRYPEFKGEKLVPLGSLYTLLAREFPFVCVNEIWCLVDYQLDGSSATVARQYFQSPRGFRYDAVLNLRHGLRWSFRMKNLLKIGLLDRILDRHADQLDRVAPWFVMVALKPLSSAAYLYMQRRGRVQ